MTQNKFDDPTQFILNKITIDGVDLMSFFVNLTIYENIYIPTVTGELMLLETDSGEFMEKNKIEFTEDIHVSAVNALDQELNFKGVCCGVRGETTKDSKRIYVVEFSSKTARMNESSFVTKRFNNIKPQAVVQEMLDKRIKTKGESELMGDGEPMNFVGSRRKPFDIIKYVCTHGVTSESKATDKKQAKEEKTKGTTGFLCWETLKGYRFASVDQLKTGEVGMKHVKYKKQLAKRGVGMEQAMRGVIEAEFPKLGNMQDKQRSGAFNNVTVLFDMDKGYYKEYGYESSKKTATEKQQEINSKPTRYLLKTTSNERHNLECESAQSDTGDATRRQLAQNVVRQNTFDDQIGEFTLPPSFEMRAGDRIDFEISKVKSEKEGGYDEKHSGEYIIKGVAHHLFSNGKAYTKLITMRSTTQQDDATSKK